MATTYLSRTTGAPTSAKKFTISGWFKLAFTDTSDHQFFQTYHDSNNREHMYFSGNDLRFYCVDGGSTAAYLQTERKFRDNNAWYHIVIACDTTQGTAADRMKMYINGVQETDFVSETYPAQDFTFRLNTNAQSIVIGRYMGSNDFYYDGIISHYHFIDGTQYAASDFGSFDNTTGEWKINPSPNVTYGNNGWFIFKDNASVTDQSGVGNNWTTTAGTLTKTEDNPSNIFCTMNPLQFPNDAIQSTFANGNTSMSGNNSHWQRGYGTIAAKSKGKWYYEWKATATNSDNNRIGWDSVDLINEGTDSYYSGLTIDGAGELRGGIRGYNNYDPNAVQMTAAHSGGNFSFGTNDFLGMAIDLDNQTISVYKNGNLEINAYSYSGASNCSILKSRGHFIAPSVNFYSSSGNANTGSFNFGNGAFGSTQLTGTTYADSNSQGVFKYQPPTNYLAWCTKNLNA